LSDILTSSHPFDILNVHTGGGGGNGGRGVDFSGGWLGQTD